MINNQKKTRTSIMKTKVERKEQIQQLDASIIVKRRKNKIDDMGYLEDSKIDFTCRNCVHFATARTPFDSDFRKMRAWKNGEVKLICPCPHLNGVKNENGEKELLKGGKDASQCPFFQLNRNRIPQKYFDFIVSADKGEIPNCDNLDKFYDAVKEQEQKIALAQEKVDKAKVALDEAKKEKEELLTERDYLFLERYSNYTHNDVTLPIGFAMLIGYELGNAYEKRQKNLQKIIDAGYDPSKKKFFPYTVTSLDLQKIMTNHRDVTYGGKFNNGVDVYGRTLDSYIGEKIELEGEPYEVVSRGAKRLVVFVETTESLERRKKNTIANLIFSENKIKWKCPIIEQPTMDYEENTDESDNSTDNEEDSED